MENQTFKVINTTDDSTAEKIDCEDIHNLISSLPQSLSLSLICLSVLFIILAITGVSGNVLIMLVFSRRRDLHSNSNILLLFLSVVDFVASVMVQPLYAAFNLATVYQHVQCGLFVCARILNFLTCGYSLVIICLITLERCLCIFLPLRYNLWITKNRLIFTTNFLLFLWTIYVGIRFREVASLSPSGLESVSAGVIITTLVICSIAYLFIFRVANRHHRQIAAQEIRQSQIRLKRESKVSRTAVLIMGTLYGCYLPVTCTLVAHDFVDYTPVQFFNLYGWTLVPVFMNSTLNPCIYTLRNRDIKAALYQLLGITVVIPFTNSFGG